MRSSDTLVLGEFDESAAFTSCICGRSADGLEKDSLNKEHMEMYVRA